MDNEWKARVVDIEMGQDDRGRPIIRLTTEFTVSKALPSQYQALFDAVGPGRDRLEPDVEAKLATGEGPSAGQPTFQRWLRDENGRSHGGAGSYASYARSALRALRDGKTEPQLTSKQRSGLKDWRRYLESGYWEDGAA